MGGLLDASTPSTEVVAAAEADAGSYTWVAAAIGSQNAAGYQLATGCRSWPIGGFNGSDPSPTLAQFQALVAAGQDPLLHRAAAAAGGGPAAAAARPSEIATGSRRTSRPDVGGVTVYDLTAGR